MSKECETLAEAIIRNYKTRLLQIEVCENRGMEKIVSLVAETIIYRFIDGSSITFLNKKHKGIAG